MSAARLLILGVLTAHSPAHGYSIRRQLETWRAEQWAHIAYGSIYFALSKMAEEGLVEMIASDQVGKRPARTLYAVTDAGKTEFQRLLREYWWERKPVVDPFQVALSFMHRMPTDELLAAMRTRAGVLRAMLEGLTWAPDMKALGAPRHIIENYRLVRYHMEAELRWTEEAIEKVERGELP